jgi:hypothetical protein
MGKKSKLTTAAVTASREWVTNGKGGKRGREWEVGKGRVD